MARPRRRPKDPEGRMPLADHFREFRNRLVKSAIAIVLGAVVGWVVYSPHSWFEGVFNFLKTPITRYAEAHPERADEVLLTFSGITTAFSLQLSVSIFVGIILASPVWIYQIWAFIVPGLTRREKRISLAFMGAAFPLFLAGIAMAQVSLPLVVNVMLEFTPTGTANFQAASDYINFVTRFSLAFGFAFLLPVFLVALNFIGMLPTSAMLRVWRPAVLGIFVFSAMMMPTPDPYSMFLLAGPLILFYFAAVGIAKVLEKRKKANRPAWLDVSDTQASDL